MSTTVRNYTGRIRHTPAQGVLLQQNFDNWQKVFSVGYSRLGILCGAYRPIPENLDYPKDLVEKWNSWNFKEGEKPGEGVYKTIVTFVNWFPAEQLTDENRTYAVSASEAVSYFVAVWNNAWGPFSLYALHAIQTFQLKEGVSFINRRLMFDQSGLDPKFVQSHLFSKDNLGFKGAFGPDQSQKWRNVISKCFGTAVKMDTSIELEIIECLLDVFMDDTVVMNRIVVQDVLKHNNFWKKWDGRSRYLNNLVEDGPNLDKAFRKKLLEKKASIEARQSLDDLPGNFRNFFINSIEALGLFEFSGNSELFYAAYAQPWGQISSNRSNCVHRITDQLELFVKNDQLQLEYTKEIGFLMDFCEQMAVKLGIPSYQIREHQDNGLDLFRKYLDLGYELPEALKTVAEDLDVKSLTNSNRELLSYLYENKRDFDVDRIRRAVRWHYQNERIHSSRLGYVANVLEHPLRPQYGQSKPAGKIVQGIWRKSPAVDWKLREGFDSDWPHINVVLLTDQGLVRDVRLNIDASRAEREFLYLKPEQPVGKVLRNTKYLNSAFNASSPPNVSLLNESSTYCLTVYQSDKSFGHENCYWSVGIALNIEYESPKINKDALGLGIDLGWRIPAAYSLITHQDQVNPVSHGVLSWMNNGVDLFDGNAPAPQEVMDFCNYLHDLLDDEVDLPLNMSFTSAVKLCCVYLKRQLRFEFSADLLKNVEKLVGLVSPHFGSRYARTFIANQGGLSWQRLEMLDSLKILLKTVIGGAERDSIPLPAIFGLMRDRVEQKLNNLRRERARIIGRMILNKALDCECNFIAVEDLDIPNSRRNRKWLNKGNASWCAKRILEYLEQQAPLHGIFIFKVNPNFSSHLDVDGGQLHMLEQVNPVTIPEKTPQGKFYKSVSSLEKKLESYLRQDTTPLDRLYRDATDCFLKGGKFSQIVDNYRLSCVEKLFVPVRGGLYANSKILGVVLSDEVAAQILGQRGFERLRSIEKYRSARSA